LYTSKEKKKRSGYSVRPMIKGTGKDAEILRRGEKEVAPHLAFTIAKVVEKDQKKRNQKKRTWGGRKRKEVREEGQERETSK